MFEQVQGHLLPVLQYLLPQLELQHLRHLAVIQTFPLLAEVLLVLQRLLLPEPPSLFRHPPEPPHCVNQLFF
jgi:hypothetical protein